MASEVLGRGAQEVSNQDGNAFGGSKGANLAARLLLGQGSGARTALSPEKREEHEKHAAHAALAKLAALSGLGPLSTNKT